MKIGGLQTLTLLDFPGKVACTVFFDGCNFRCPFCHNSELLDGQASAVMDDDTLLDFLQRRKGLLDGVCITGGEPTLQADLLLLLQRIKALGYAIKLDTNGYRPEILRECVENGLVDYVAMDIKNAPDAYAATAGVTQVRLACIEESMRFLLSGTVDYEFRTTVVAELHDVSSFHGIGQWLTSMRDAGVAKKFFLQPFVDRDTVCYSNFHAPSDEEMAQYLEILRSFVISAALRGV